MANVIRTMKDVDGNTVFPRTYAQAVTIGDGSVNLEGALSNRPEKPSLLPAKTTLADTDLVTVEGTGGVVNKMTIGALRQKLDELSRASVTFTPSSGYYVLYNRSKREGNKIFINIVIGKTSGSFPANAEVLVGTFGNIENSESQRFGGVCGQYAYEMYRPVYCILGADKQLGFRTPPDVSNAVFASAQFSYIV